MVRGVAQNGGEICISGCDVVELFSLACDSYSYDKFVLKS